MGTVNQRFLIGAATGLGLPYNGPHTLEAWVKPSVDGYGNFIERGGDLLGMANSGLGADVTVRFGYENSVGGQFALTGVSTFMSVNGIHHLVGTHDGSTVILGHS